MRGRGLQIAATAAVCGACAGAAPAGGRLDADIRTVTSEDRAALGIAPGVEGVVVERAGPAASVLRRGDTIVAVDDRRIRDAADLTDAVFVAPGPTARLSVLRDGTPAEVVLTPTPAERRSGVGIGLLALARPPLSFDTQGVGLDSLADVELGPDEHGAMLFRLIGYESGPAGWDLRLVLLQFGEMVEPIAEVPPPDRD